VPDSCTIEAKFAAQRGVCSAENAFWAWLSFLTANNLADEWKTLAISVKSKGQVGL
jgi:hypothetical protein